MKTKLRIGFIVDPSCQVPAWYAAIINDVAEQGFTVQFIAMNVSHSKLSFALRAFKKFERWWFGKTWDAAALTSIHHLVSDHSSIRLPDNNFLVSESSLDLLHTIHPDLLFTVDYDGEKENISGTAKHGLWYIRMGKSGNKNSLSGFWEVMQDEVVIPASLLMRKEGKDYFVYKGSTTTVPYSVANNFNALAWKASSFLLHRLSALEKNEAIVEQIKEPAPAHMVHPLPGTASLMLLFFKNIYRYLAWKTGTLRPPGRFTLLYSFQSFDPATIDQLSLQPLALPKGCFYADPFVIEKDGINYIFLEAYEEQLKKAHIVVLEADGSGIISQPKKVLEAPYHLSYPFVFAHEGNYYMIPETAANKTVSLYRARSFPYDWELVMHLMEGIELADATLHFENGLWWLFAAGRNHPFVSTNDQLFLFYSEALLSGEWKPHIQNPVATQVENCRPAGRLFRHEGKLFRPAQDNASRQYGFGIRINEVTVLTKEIYKEQEVTALDPASLGLKACHHIDHSSSIIVLDGIVQ